MKSLRRDIEFAIEVFVRGHSASLTWQQSGFRQLMAVSPLGKKRSAKPTSLLHLEPMSLTFRDKSVFRVGRHLPAIDLAGYQVLNTHAGRLTGTSMV